MELVTGRTGKAHVKSWQAREQNQGMFGNGVYRLETGKMMELEVVNANEVRLLDGACMIQGALSTTERGAYDSLTIENGTIGMRRIDLIVWRYTYDAEKDVETAEWVVLKGNPAESNPQEPIYKEGDIQAGDNIVEVPFAKVVIEEITIEEAYVLVPVMQGIDGINKDLSQMRNILGNSVFGVENVLQGTPSVLSAALNTMNGTSMIITGSGTTDVPSSNYRYCAGLVLKRTASQIFILLLGRDGGIATNAYEGSGWIGWKTR